MGPLLRGQVNRAGRAVSLAENPRVLWCYMRSGKPRWIGPCGGATSQELLAGLSAMGIRTTGATRQPTRTNLESWKTTERLQILRPEQSLVSRVGGI
jgi:hypothetical protein